MKAMNKMDLLSQAKNDFRVATALHEAGHAVTYINIGRSFEYVSIQDSITMGNGEPIDSWDRALTAMAGPVVESLMSNPGADDETVYRWIIETRNERLEYVHEESSDDADDYLDAGADGVTVLPMVLATIESRWAHVEAIAAAALQLDPLPYVTIQSLVNPLSFDHEQFTTAFSRWSSVAAAHK